MESAIREVKEETGLEVSNLIFKGLYEYVNPVAMDRYMIFNYITKKIPTKDISLSKEHFNYKWLCFEEAVTLLKWDSNKTALWELNKRLLNQINTEQSL